MKNYIILIHLIWVIIYKGIECEEEDHTMILSTKKVENATTREILDLIRKYTNDILIIASVNVNGQKSGLTLEDQKFGQLGLPNSTKYKEKCVELHEVLNRTFERIGFDFIENINSLKLVDSGLWLYLPVVDSASLGVFKEVAEKYKDATTVTFIMTECDLLKTKQKVKKVNKVEKNEDEIRTTPIIVQQTVVMLFFAIILALGMYMAFKIKTPSSLLVPQQIKPKIS